MLTQNQNEALQEIANIGMGQAGASIANVFNEFVQLSIPRIFILPPHEIPQVLSTVCSDKVTAVRQAFHGRLRGEAIVLYGDQRYNDLGDLMGYEQEHDGLTRIELLLDVSNILVGACLGGIAGQLHENIGFKAPSLMAEHAPIGSLLPSENTPWNIALLVDVNFRLEKRCFSCHLMILMAEGGIKSLAVALDRFLEAC